MSQRTRNIQIDKPCLQKKLKFTFIYNKVVIVSPGDQDQGKNAFFQTNDLCPHYIQNS